MEQIIQAIREGKIFIYPTDTIYGIGVNALISEGVEKIRRLKRRETKPFSVIVPSKEWIMESCFAQQSDLDKYLPGPYTLFLKSKEGVVASEVNPAGGGTLGVRIPDHWFADLVREAGVPFVTTSVNFSGEKHMEKLGDVPEEILANTDFIIYEGEKPGRSSEKINLSGV